MAKRSLLKALIQILSFPFFISSCFVEMLDIRGIRKDIEKCLNVIDFSYQIIPQKTVLALIAAEDHWNSMHCGIDPIAMLRALFVRIMRNQIQGASTIEQQFVRTAVALYKYSLRRKVREQLLAIAVQRRRSKHQIACAYLSIAYFGTECVGIEAFKKRRDREIGIFGEASISSMIARLKYPEPKNRCEEWQCKIRRRINYIEKRMPKLNHKEEYGSLGTLLYSATSDMMNSAADHGLESGL